MPRFSCQVIQLGEKADEGIDGVTLAMMLIILLNHCFSIFKTYQ